MEKLTCTLFLLTFSLFVISQDFIDPETPSGIKPVNSNIGTGWNLNFSDEFNGTAVDINKWNIDNSTKSRTPRPEIGINSWFWKPANVEVKDGKLVLKVSKNNNTIMHCGSINSNGKYMSRYGYYEARIRVADITKGTHTAFWLHSTNMDNVDGTGNDGAEIDIFESAWTENYTKSVIHIDGYGTDHKASTKQYSTPGIHSEYHTWGMWWTKDFIKIYYDGILKVQYTDTKWIPWIDEYLWLSDGASFGLGDEPDTNIFFVNQALGFLTEAYVDYIRVWKVSEEGPTPGTNLINNGTFDNNGTNWTGNNTDILYELNAETNINGITCRMPSITNGRNIRQTIMVKPGSTYELSFKGRIQNAVGASGTQVNNHTTLGTATLKGEIIAPDDEVLLRVSTQEPSDQTLTGNFIVPEGVSTVIVVLSKDWNVGYIDDIELVEKINLATDNQYDEKNIKVRVNKNKLLIDSSSIITSVAVFDMTGSMIAQQTPMQKSATIDIITRGVYVVAAKLDGGRFSRIKIATL